MSASESGLPATDTRAYLESAVQAYKLPQVLWGCCIFATTGDALVTLWGLSQPGVYESVQISRIALDVAGPLGLVAKDAAVLVAGYAVYRVSPVPFKYSIPAGMAGGRLYLVWSNLAVLGVL